MIRALLLLALLAGAVACGSGDEGPPPRPADRPSRVVDAFEVTESREGRIEWHLVSDKAEYFREESHTRLEGVTLVFFNPDGSEKATLTSDRGRAEDMTGNLVAEGNVVVVTVEGDTLTTEELHYDNVGDEIRGPGAVRLAKPDRVLTGEGFRSKPDLTSYEIDRNVQVTLHGDAEALDERD